MTQQAARGKGIVGEAMTMPLVPMRKLRRVMSRRFGRLSTDRRYKPDSKRLFPIP
jgi:hypothetical protein